MSPSADPNDFSFKTDKDALICPYQAHIRKTNPRGDLAAFIQGQTDKSERALRILRRGITYGERPDLAPDSKLPAPETGIGLLFMCYQSGLISFILQQDGADSNEFVKPGVGPDATLGVNAAPTTQQWPVNGVPNAKPFLMANFIRMRGGEYFFAPKPGIPQGIMHGTGDRLAEGWRMRKPGSIQPSARSGHRCCARRASPEFPQLISEQQTSGRIRRRPQRKPDREPIFSSPSSQARVTAASPSASACGTTQRQISGTDRPACGPTLLCQRDHHAREIRVAAPVQALDRPEPRVREDGLDDHLVPMIFRKGLRRIRIAMDERLENRLHPGTDRLTGAWFDRRSRGIDRKSEI